MLLEVIIIEVTVYNRKSYFRYPHLIGYNFTMIYREKDNVVIDCNLKNNNVTYLLCYIVINLSMDDGDHSKIALMYKCYDNAELFSRSHGSILLSSSHN